MGSLSSNYFIKISNIYDNLDTISINDIKRFVIDVYIEKRKSFKRDYIRYKICIRDDFNTRYHKLIPNIDNKFMTTIGKY